jgi:CheY-like chemotaxis protein
MFGKYLGFSKVMSGAFLVVEDSLDDAVLLERAFLRAGLVAPLRFVRDGQQAIEYLEGGHHFNDRGIYPLPNLVLVDLKMPRLDGFGLLNWLRDQPSVNRSIGHRKRVACYKGHLVLNGNLSTQVQQKYAVGDTKNLDVGQVPERTLQ